MKRISPSLVLRSGGCMVFDCAVIYALCNHNFTGKLPKLKEISACLIDESGTLLAELELNIGNSLRSTISLRTAILYFEAWLQRVTKNIPLHSSSLTLVTDSDLTIGVLFYNSCLSIGKDMPIIFSQWCSLMNVLMAWQENEDANVDVSGLVEMVESCNGNSSNYVKGTALSHCHVLCQVLCSLLQENLEISALISIAALEDNGDIEEPCSQVSSPIFFSQEKQKSYIQTTFGSPKKAGLFQPRRVLSVKRK